MFKQYHWVSKLYGGSTINNMKKQILFLGVIFLVSLIVAFVVFSRQRSPQTAVPAPTTAYKIKDPPQEIRVPDAPTGVVFTYLGNQTDFPTTLPSYKAEKSILPNNQIDALTKKLGFVSSPINKISGETERRTWNEKDKSVSFTTSLSQQSLSYQKMMSPITSVRLSDEQLVEYARSFLSQISPSSAAFRGSIQTNASFDGLIIQESPAPPLSLVVFSLLVENKYPFLAANYESPVSSVVVDAGGAVRSLSFVLPPTLVQTKNVKLLSLETAINGLNEGKGLLLSSQKEDGWGGSPAFHTVTIKNVQISYVQQSNTGAVEPAFVFFGTATGEGGTSLSVSYLLFASAE
jgi:hypothetical protein